MNEVTEENRFHLTIMITGMPHGDLLSHVLNSKLANRLRSLDHPGVLVLTTNVVDTGTREIRFIWGDPKPSTTTMEMVEHTTKQLIAECE